MPDGAAGDAAAAAGRPRKRRKQGPPAPAGVADVSEARLELPQAAEAAEARAGGAKRRRPSAARAGSADPAAAELPAAPAVGEPAAGRAGTRASQREGARAPDQAAAARVHTPRTGWWGAASFVSAGCLEGLDAPRAARGRQAFDEDDQAALYLAAHAAKTANKKGLGTRAQLRAPSSSVARVQSRYLLYENGLRPSSVYARLVCVCAPRAVCRGLFVGCTEANPRGRVRARRLTCHCGGQHIDQELVCGPAVPVIC